MSLCLCRFKVEQKIDLKSTLQELGIKNIFTNDADLSAMTGDTQKTHDTIQPKHTGTNITNTA